MKKLIKTILVILILLISGIYISKNYIVKKILEVKLTELNKGKVDIKKVKFSPFEKNITLYGIDFTSRKNTLKNFVSIDKFEADYDLYYDDKRILISRALFSGLNFMTDRNLDGNTGTIVREENIIPKKEVAQEVNKDNAIKNLEELASAKTDINKILLNELMQQKYEKTRKEFEAREEYWNKKIKQLEKSKDYKIVKSMYFKIKKEKNPLKLLKKRKDIERASRAFKNLSSQVKLYKKYMVKDFEKIMRDDDINSNLETATNRIIGDGEVFIKDLDLVTNYYLNEICKESIDEFMIRYRSLMKEVEIRRDEDMKIDKKWEFFAEEVTLETDLYNLELSGKINNISSRLSKNLEDIPFVLKAVSEKSNGEIKGSVNIKELESNINILISKFDFSDLEDLTILHEYVLSGNASLDKNIKFTKDSIVLSGNVKAKDIKLASSRISEDLNIKNLFLKDMIIPLLNDIKIANIEYSYDSNIAKLQIKSNVSKEILDILNSDKSMVREKIRKDILNESEESIRNYKMLLDSDNDKIINSLNNKLEKELNYVEKIQSILEKYDIADKILK